MPVPVHAYRHLPLLQPLHESSLLCAARAFWRSRGLVLPVCMRSKLVLDVAGTMRQVALRGGYWACTAAQVSPLRPTMCSCCPSFQLQDLTARGVPQGEGEAAHEHEDYIAWRNIAQGSWVGGSKDAIQEIPWIAADLQEFYRVWLLPFEQHVLARAGGAVCTVTVAAGVLRKIAEDRTQDSLLRHVVRRLSALAELDASKLAALVAAPDGGEPPVLCRLVRAVFPVRNRREATALCRVRGGGADTRGQDEPRRRARAAAGLYRRGADGRSADGDVHRGAAAPRRAGGGGARGEG